MCNHSHPKMKLFEFIINSLILQALHAQLAISLNINDHLSSLYAQSTPNPLFRLTQNFIQCNAKLYQYGQTAQQYSLATPSIITITGNTQAVTVSVGTQYGRFSPSLNATTCPASPASTPCSIGLSYNCPSILSNSNYFDIISLSIATVGTFSFFLNCNIAYNTTYFEYSGLILICLATAILTLATQLGRWNSFNGYGIKYGYKMIFFISGCVLAMAVLSLYEPGVAGIILDVGNTVTIVFSVSVLAIEGLYFLKIKPIERVIIQKDGGRMKFRIRILDVLGVAASIPIVVLWWLLESTWIFSDVLGVILVVSVIKVFKFVSLKIALLAYLIIVSIYIAGTIIVSVQMDKQYQQYFLYEVATPYQLSLPLLTPAFGQRCTSVSITTVAFPGLLVSYLRRFDQSRSTRIYLFTAIGTYFLGSVLWWLVSTFSYYPLPFDAFCEPIMIIAFTLFAFKRKELRTLWEGKFFDEEFKNKDEIEAVGRAMEMEIVDVDYFGGKLGESLFFQIKDDTQIDQKEQRGHSPKNNNQDAI